ncbi:STM3941 family protein [Ancylomarina sp. YFZ004]
MKEKIEIPFSKNKIYRLIAGSLIFIIAGIWIFFNPDLYQDFPLKFLRDPIVIKSIGAICVLFFGLTGIIGIKKLFDKKLDS